MARPKIYVCRPLPEKALALLRGRTEMRLWEQNEIPTPRWGLTTSTSPRRRSGASS